MAFAPFGNIVGNGFPENSAITTNGKIDQRERSTSFFGSITHHFSESLRLSAGLRYSRVRKSASRTSEIGTSTNAPNFANFVAAPIAAQNGIASFLGVSLADFPINRRVDDAFLPSTNLQYDVVQDVMVYASYTKGFKAGGFSNGTLADVFGPEKVNAYEIGLKSRLLNRALTLNFAIFQSDYKNLQETSQIITPTAFLSIVQNSAASRSKGVELSSLLRLSKQFSIRADVAYLDARFTNYRTAPCTTLATFQNPTCIQDLSGKRRPWAPEWSGSVGLTLEVPLANAQLRIDPTIAFTSSYQQQSLNDPLYLQPGYAKIDLRVGIGDRDQGWELAMIGKNLTNKATASFRNGFATSPGSLLALPERPRSVAIQFTVRN